MLKKMMAAAGAPKKSANKRTILQVLRWQLVFLGIAFVLSVLDLANVMQLRASAVLVFIFVALGNAVAAYLDIREAGFVSDEE